MCMLCIQFNIPSINLWVVVLSYMMGGIAIFIRFESQHVHHIFQNEIPTQLKQAFSEIHLRVLACHKDNIVKDRRQRMQPASV